MEAVQHWEQTDLLGFWAAPAEPAAAAPPAAAAAPSTPSTSQAAATAPKEPQAHHRGPAMAATAQAAAGAVHAEAAVTARTSVVEVQAPAGTVAIEAPAGEGPSPAVVVVQVPAERTAAGDGLLEQARPPAGTEPQTPLAEPADPGPASGAAPASAIQPLPSLSLAPAAPETAPPVLERLLILDTETTALHPKDGQCIEVGAVLFDVASRSVLTQVSFLLPCLENSAEAINGIPAPVSQLEQPWREALGCFLAMVAAADAILAHNAAFDRQWFGRGPLPALDKPWICSMEDISWPRERQLRGVPSVRDLAIAYGVPVWAAHRALTDCIYLVQVLERCDDLERLLQAAREPRQLYRAQLSYDERHQAKEAGFRWNDPVPGAWTKRLSEREAAALPFPVQTV